MHESYTPYQLYIDMLIINIPFFIRILITQMGIKMITRYNASEKYFVTIIIQGYSD